MAMMAFFTFPQSSQAALRQMQMHYIDNYLEEAAANERMEPALLRAVVRVESSFNHRAVSPVGARGLMQLMPSTAAQIGDMRALDKRNPHANIMAGAHYLRQLIDQFHGNLKLAIAAYNAGPNAVLKYKGVPPYTETRLYVHKVFLALAKERSAALSGSFSSSK